LSRGGRVARSGLRGCLSGRWTKKGSTSTTETNAIKGLGGERTLRMANALITRKKMTVVQFDKGQPDHLWRAQVLKEKKKRSGAARGSRCEEKDLEESKRLSRSRTHPLGNAQRRERRGRKEGIEKWQLRTGGLMSCFWEPRWRSSSNLNHPSLLLLGRDFGDPAEGRREGTT